MKTITLPASYLEFDAPEELPEDDLALLNQAAQSLQSSYSPYSRYRVGAAVLLANGVVYTGSNQENIAFPSGLCAERVAVFAAASEFPDVPILTVAITAKSEQFPVTSPVPPCGACRQVMMEYETRQKQKIRLVLRGETGKIWVVEGIGTILPMNFTEDGLRRE
jgi:cytidine deaminase